MKLSPPMELPQFGGEWHAYCDALYGFFLKSIANGRLSVDGLPVKCRFHPMSKGMAYCFWHIIQDGPSNDDRIPDLRRCERITWIPDIVRVGRGNPADVRWWKNTRNGRKNLLLWAWENDYVVILELRSARVMLVTAYGPLTYRRRKSFASEWQIYQKRPW